jgi:mandelamide amidase
LRAFVELDERTALVEAGRAGGTGPLAGMVLAVKDNIDVRGRPTTAGTPSLRDNRPDRDAPVVASLRQAGALVLGKANMHELAYGVTSDNGAFGRVGNPVDPARIAGGSSGGTAAAVAAGLVTAGLGTETGCSVRVPAALCGVVGFRPTTGRYSSDGVVPVSPTRDTIGLIARDVPVVAALDAQITGEPRSEPLTSLVGLRLGAPRHPFRDGMAPELQDAFDERLAELRAAGCTVVEAELPDGVADAVAPCGMAIALYETPGALDDYLAAHGSPVRFADVVQGIASPDVAAVLGPLVSEPVPEEAYRQAIDVDRPALRQALLDYFAEHRLDAVVTPTAPLTAPVLRDGGLISFAGNDEPAFPVLVRNSDLWATVGWPAVSVPAFRDRAGLPFGIDLQGLEGHDTDLLAAAHGCLQVWQDGADDGAR